MSSTLTRKLLSSALPKCHQQPSLTTVGHRSFNTAIRGELPRFENMGQTLDYAAKNLDSIDAQTAGKLLGNVTFRLKFEEEPRALIANDTVKELVKKIQEAVSTCDGPQLAYFLGEVAKLITRNSYPTPTMTKIAEEAFARFQKGTPIEPVKFPYVVKNLIILGLKSLSLANFVKAESIKGLSLYNPAQCRALLSVLSDLGLKEMGLISALFNRIAEQIDEFRNEDVVATLVVFRYIGMQHPATVRKCVELAVQHTQLFEIHQIQKILNSLCLLRAIQPRQAATLVESLQKRFAQIGKGLVTILYNLTLINYNDISIISEMVSVCLSCSDLSFIDTLNMSYILCFYDLQDRKDALSSLLSTVFQNLTAPNSAILAKLAEIIPTAEKEFGIKLNIPENIQTAVKEYVSNAATPAACYRALDLSSELSGKFAVNFEKEVMVGPYKANLVDKEQKIVMEILGSKDVTGTGLRRRHYQSLGYNYCSVPAFRISANPELRPSALQQMQHALEAPLLRLGKLSNEEIETRRAAVRQSRLQI